MRRIVWIWMMLCAMCLQAQTVTNVVARQVGNTVEISYDLDMAATVSLLLSQDGGATYSATPKSVVGDVGNTSPGHKRMVWNLLADGSDWDVERARFKVVAQKTDKITFTLKDVSFVMIAVEGGTFTMGATSEQGSDAKSDESPTHQVTLSEYYIGQTEVTQGLWKAVMETTVRQQRDKANPDWSINGEGDNYPMYYINWEECQGFIYKLNTILSSQLGGKHFALPTEAQWEYAARGGKKSKGYKYSGSSSIGTVAWYKDNSGNSSHPVASKNPNELGIYDMCGNVEEWCQDRWGIYSSSSQTNPTGASSGSSFLHRGGCWSFEAKSCRVTNRISNPPTDRFNGMGLRLVLQ